MTPVMHADAWWAVSPAAALGRKKPLGMRRLGRDVVLWRDAAGVAHAASSVCPHRGADLGQGRVVAGELECPYHGFRYAASAECTAIPCEGPGARIPPRLRLREVVSVREEHGWLWLASGNPPADVPWIAQAPASARGCATRTMAWDVPLARVVEGMLDIHHFAFTHRRYAPGGYVLLDPYDAHWDASGVLRSRGMLRREGKSGGGWAFRMDLAFPGVLHLQLGGGSHAVVVCTPVDAEHTWIGVRYGFDFGQKIPWLGRLAAEIALAMEMRFIQPDDLRMLRGSRPRHAVPEDGQYVHADKAAALWHARAKKLSAHHLPLTTDAPSTLCPPNA